MWHVSSRSGVAPLRTAMHLLLTYLRVYSNETDDSGQTRATIRLEYTHSGREFSSVNKR